MHLHKAYLAGDEMIELKTKRLIIREHQFDDLQTHHNLYSDEEVMMYLQDYKTKGINESKKSLLSIIEEAKKPSRVQYAFRIIERKTSNHVGEIFYNLIANMQGFKLVEIFFLSYKAYWNQGYMTEALKEVMRHAFDENAVLKIKATSFEKNNACLKLLTRCGFVVDTKEMTNQKKGNKIICFKITKPRYKELEKSHFM